MLRPNEQPIHKFQNHPFKKLYVHSIFSTIQGEGPYAGERAIFVRLFGCNLQCPGCDTDYTSNNAELDCSEVVNLVKESHEAPYLVVITGGEPFRQNIGDFCNELLAEGYKVQVESNGTLAPSFNLSSEVYIVCSPKTGRIQRHMLERMNALKYVVNWRSVAEDGLPLLALNHTAKPHVARPPADFQGPIFVQPMDANDMVEDMMNKKAAVKLCIEHGYTLQLQIHKLVGVE